MRRPGVHRVPALDLHPAHVVSVERDEREAEPLIQFLFPLQHHRRRGRDDDAADPLTHQQLANDQAGFDRLAKADVVGDEQVHARQE